MTGEPLLPTKDNPFSGSNGYPGRALNNGNQLS
jgi:hypothetical protein